MTLKRQKQVAKRVFNRDAISGTKGGGRASRHNGRMDRPHKQEQASAGMDKIFNFLGFEAPSVTQAKNMAELLDAVEKENAIALDENLVEPVTEIKEEIVNE